MQNATPASSGERLIRTSFENKKSRMEIFPIRDSPYNQSLLRGGA
jgi:hypothetical protein